MRPIKFRGLTESGEWVYGFLMDHDRIVQGELGYRVDPETVGQLIGQQSRNKDVYQDDILYDQIEHDHGDERIFYVVTWINERSSFALLTASERKSYDDNGISAIDRDFDGFYYEIDSDSLNKMFLKGNIHLNPELL